MIIELWTTFEIDYVLQCEIFEVSKSYLKLARKKHKYEKMFTEQTFEIVWRK